MADDCVFCSVVAGESRSYRVYDDDATAAFLDIHPVARGHTLVVPRDHYETLTDAPEDVVAATFRTVRRVAAAIEDRIDPDGLTVVQSSGEAAGQDVFHLHVHLIPRYENDGIGFAPGRIEIDPEDGDAVAAEIREGL